MSQRHPQFQIIEHQVTGILTGRLFVPAARAATDKYRSWKQTVSITSTKIYADGSERIYFYSSNAEYERLAKHYPSYLNNKFMRDSSQADIWRRGELAITVKPDYSDLSTRQLKKIAKATSLEGYSKMKKAELVLAV